MPQDGREFPDLDPIRGPRLSESDSRSLPGADGSPRRGPGRRGRHSAPDAGGLPGADRGPSGGNGPGGGTAPWREAAPSDPGRPPAFDFDSQQYGQQQDQGYGARQAGGQPPRHGQQSASQQFGSQQGQAQFGGQ
jgi:hypothetical protein